MKRFYLGLYIFLLFFTQHLFAAISIDNTSSGNFSSASSLTISHTTGSGSERLMLVGVSLWNEDFESVTSVTYGGVALTRVGSTATGDDSRVEIWRLTNPNAGSANVVVTFNETVQKNGGAGVMTFTGVDQINPVSSYQGNTGDSDRASVSVSSSSGDLVFAVAAAEQQDDPFDIDRGTERWNYKANGNNKLAGAGATRDGQSSTSIRWDLEDSDDWAIAGVSINASSGGGSGPLPSPDLEYRFDECSLSSGVTDSAGNYDGTANSTDSSAVELVINRSLDLSATGTFDYVTVNRDALNGLNDFSISTWIKTGTSKAQQEVFQALGNSTGDDEIEIYLINSSQVRLNVGDNGNTLNAGTTLTDNNWHHLVITRSGNDMCLYVDGNFAACHDDGGGSQVSISNSSSVILGQEQDSYGGSFNSGQAFDGYIDEFKVYASVLSSSHAQQIYTNENSGLNADGTSRSASNCTVMVPTPYSEHRMDETSWDGTSGEIEDNIGSNDGSVVDTGSGNVTNIADGKICRAGSVGANSGTNTYYAIDSQVDIDDEIGDTGSISFWYRSADTWGNNSSRKILLSASSTGSDDKYFFITMETSGRLRYGLENTSDADYRYSSSTSFSYPSTEWVHIVATWDMANRNMQLYVNGAQEVNATFSQSLSIGEMLTLYLGDNRSDYIAGEGNVSADGDFDELLTFRQVLTSAQVTEIYTNQNAGNNYDGTSRGSCATATLSPVADWRFDENSWSGTDDVADSSGNDYHGTATNSSPSSDAQLCNAADLSLAGTTDFISLNKDAMDGLEDFTVIVWAKTSQTQDSTILSAASGNSGAATNEAVWYFDNSNQFWPTISDSPFDTSTRMSSTPTMRDGYWHQLAWTRKANSLQSCFFIDGVSQGCITHPDANDSNPLSVVTGGLILGQEQDSIGGGFDSSQDWEGLLDEMLIFDSVLTQTDIGNIRTNIMNSNNWDGSPRSCAASIDHYSITHDQSGVTCLIENITVSAHDSAHSAVDAGSASMTITATSGKGNWVGAVSGTSAFDNGSTDDGVATFTFASGAQSAVLQFAHPILSGTSETFGFNVTDGSITENSGSWIAADDPNITFTLAGFRFIDGAGVETIPTQIAGKASDAGFGAANLYLQAVEATTADPSVCQAAFPNDGIPKSINLAAQCSNPTSCVSGREFNVVSGSNPEVDLNAGTPETFKSVAMIFDAESKAPIRLNYNDAGEMQLQASYTVPDTGAVMTGNSNLFVVRPFGFGFPVISSAGKANPEGDETGTTSASGFIAADEPFDVEVNAYLYDAAEDTNNDGIPDAIDTDGNTLLETSGTDNIADLTDNGITPNFTGSATLSADATFFTPNTGTGQLGNFSGGTATISLGAANGSAVGLKYDEVGSIQLKGSMSNYIQSGVDIGSEYRKVGRFYPDHFVLTESAVQEQCTPFTYMQQPFSALEYKIEARSADGELTENYDLALYSNTAVLELSAEDDNDGNELSSRLTTPTSLSGWAEGVIDRTTLSSTDITDLIFQRQGGSAGLEDGPYTQLQLGMSISSELDSRNFTSSALNIDPDLAGDCTGSCTGIALGDPTELRYGRVILQSAHGPETEDLPVPFEIQYWDSAAFVRNTDDSCTAIPLANISYDGNPISSVAADRTVTVGDGSTVGNLSINGTNSDAASGDFSLIFTAPGAGTGGNDNTGYFPVGLSSIDEWLRYDWDQDGNANDISVPDAIITFGRARGNDRMIFWQERYQ
ncbi:DUF6701 domain-containing protein [Neptuniibacter sp. SY11_33]|uniref:DUF6701 domain-containing protein n=1 Tax=Neptuniibacter sp. SY11_33 TaxID=3398215 RepID=UPI0039F46F97